MTSLPFGFTEPLHFEPLFPWRNVVLLGLLAWLAWRWLKRRLAARSALPPAPQPPAPRSGLLDELTELRRRYRGAESFRTACHELAALLRQHFAAKRKQPLTTLTVGEMEGRLGDNAVWRLFRLLEVLQFSRRAPSRSDFDGVCELACEVATGSP